MLEEISENDSASVSAMSVTVVISLSPICRCFTSVGVAFQRFYPGPCRRVGLQQIAEILWRCCAAQIEGKPVLGEEEPRPRPCEGADSDVEEDPYPMKRNPYSGNEADVDIEEESIVSDSTSGSTCIPSPVSKSNERQYTTHLCGCKTEDDSAELHRLVP